MRFGKKRNIGENDETHSKVLLVITDQQIDITNFCEIHGITREKQLEKYTDELLQFIQEIYKEDIDSLRKDLESTDKQSINYDPEIIYLKYTKFNRSSYKSELGEDEYEVYLTDCKMKAYVKFREYLNFLSQLEYDDLPDVFEDVVKSVIDNNGVNIHQIVSDVYDKATEEESERKNSIIDNEDFERPTSDTSPQTLIARIRRMSKPIMRFIDHDTDQWMQFAKDSGKFRYELTCSVYSETYHIGLDKKHRFLRIDGEILDFLKNEHPDIKDSKVKKIKIRECKNPLSIDDHDARSKFYDKCIEDICDCFPKNEYIFNTKHETEDAEYVYQSLMEKFISL